MDELAIDSDIEPESGAFLIVGESLSDTSYRVHLSTSDAHQVSSGVFEPGERSFVIELAAGAALHTTLLLDDDRRRGDMSLAFDHGGALYLAPGAHPLRRFRETLEGLPPGHVAVELRHASGTVLHRHEGVELRPGETTRLDIDLRRRLLDVLVQLEFSGSFPNHASRVLFRESDTGPYELAADGSGSWYRILSTAPSVDVVVLADGYTARWLDDVDADVTCVLAPGPRVTVADPEGVCRYDPRYSLRTVFQPLDPRLSALIPPGSLGAWPRDGGTGRPFPAAGDYRVEWVATAAGGDPRTLAVDEVTVCDGYQLLELAIPVEAYERFKQERDR